MKNSAKAVQDFQRLVDQTRKVALLEWPGKPVNSWLACTSTEGCQEFGQPDCKKIESEHNLTEYIRTGGQNGAIEDRLREVIQNSHMVDASRKPRLCILFAPGLLQNQHPHTVTNFEQLWSMAPYLIIIYPTPLRVKPHISSPSTINLYTKYILIRPV